ncbi:zinc ribbon domain-containing protein, partial [Chloroflexota bacterium]
TKVQFLVPTTAEMYSAGSMDSQGNYSGGPPNRKPSSVPDWDEISYQVTTDTFRVEYYDPVIFGNPEKTISYMFRSSYPMSDMEIIVQEPIGATDFTVSPEGDRFVDVAGFNSYLYQYTNLEVDTTIQFDITYMKTAAAPSLSLSGDTVAPSLSSPGENETPNYTLIVITLVIVTVIVVAVFAWRRRTAPITRAELRRTARMSGKPAPNGLKSTPKFCSQCGNPVDGNHKFCPSCGTKIQ